MLIKRVGLLHLLSIGGALALCAGSLCANTFSVTPATVQLPASGQISQTFTFQATGFSPTSYGVHGVGSPTGGGDFALNGQWSGGNFVTGPYFYDAAVPTGFYTYQTQDAEGNVYTTTIQVLPPPSGGLSISITNYRSANWLNEQSPLVSYAFTTAPPNADPALYPASAVWDHNAANDNRACADGAGFDPHFLMYSNALPEGDWFLHLCLHETAHSSNQAFNLYHFRTDNTPPSVPAGLTVTSTLPGEADLSWSAATDALSGVGGYRVFRNGVQISSTVQASYSDTGLASGTTYAYAVSAYDLAQLPNVSGRSASVSMLVNGTSLPVIPPPPPPSLPPAGGSQTMNGVFQQLVEDRFPQKSSVMHYGLRTAAGYYRLVFPDDQMARGIRPGSQVQVRGQIFGASFTVNKVAATPGSGFIPQVVGGYHADLSVLSAPASAPASGVRKVAMILVNFNNDRSELLTAAATRDYMTVVNQFYQEQSYGQLSITSDVFGYFQLPIALDCSDPNSFATIVNAALQAAKDAGIDLSSYQSEVVVGPQGPGTPCITRLGTVGGAPGTVLETDSTYWDFAAVTSHELGHNLGLNHAQAMNCGSVIYNPAAVCTSTEYGDLYDVMGEGGAYTQPPHFNAISKEFLGWGAPRAITVSGTYSLGPYERLSSLPIALKIPLANANDSPSIEYRQNFGFDGIFNTLYLTSPEVYGGVLLHIPLKDNYTQILNMNAPSYGTYGPQFPQLDPPLHYVDYANRFSVTTVSTGPASAQVRILVPPEDSPTLMIVSPTADATVSGSVPVLVDALDRTGVTQVELYSDGVLVETLTSAPYQFAWDTTQATSGSHTLTAKAYNAAGRSYAQDISVNVILRPSATIVSPVNGSAYPASSDPDIQVNVQDPAHTVSTSKTLVNGQVICSVASATGCAFQLYSPPAGSYQVTAQLLDAQANVLANADPVTFTVGGRPASKLVKIVTPEASAKWSEGVNATLSATLAGNIPAYSDVVFLVNGKSIGSAATTDGVFYTLIWPSPVSGSYAIVAEAYVGGAAIASLPVSIVVQPNIVFENGPAAIPSDAVLKVDLAVPMSLIRWAISPADSLPAMAARTSSSGQGAFPAVDALYQTTTAIPQLDLRAANLPPGSYQVSAYGMDSSGHLWGPAEAAIQLLSPSFTGRASVFPNPWRVDQDADPHITFNALSGYTTIKIFTLSGHWIKTIATSNGSCQWDLTNDGNERVSSGIYLYLITNDQGQQIRGKLGIIR